jgi:hypothetical protein
MKKLTIFLSVVLVAMVLCDNLSAQKYARLKITLDNGLMVDGRKGLMIKDEVSLLVAGSTMVYPLDEVSLILAKKGRMGTYAVGFGGGCLALCLITVVSNPNDDDVGTLLAGSAIWTLIFVGIGAGIGALADPWKTVYVSSRHSSIMDRLNLSFSSNKFAPYNVGVVYKFNRN